MDRKTTREVVATLLKAGRKDLATTIAATEVPLSELPAPVAKLLKAAKLEPEMLWDGIGGKIVMTRGPSRITADVLKKIVKLPGLRWLETKPNEVTLAF